MRLFAFIMAILIAFPNLGSAFTSSDCCSHSSILGEVLIKEAQVEVKSCCSHSPEKDGEKECGSKCKCASCFTTTLYNVIASIISNNQDEYSQTVADFTQSYFFEFPINIWQPPKQA